ncbi:TonB-dependent receptor [Sphingobium indicum BiD32]|uniref:TonB-dependent receptor n=1 Tax=Sphingobium indicum BiD32 TaxID=1301087 RepID=N1MGC8_9SPHN|nr:TonB-dependent receptor [Sphingobium indicum]CCW16260.1 TonB-dependent receptor [Sphingobium indicum BiD32]
MISSFKRAFAISLLGSVALPASAAWAQAEGAATGIEEIVVTAQRREQNLQVVPIAVTAVSSEALKNNGVVSIADVSSLAPNLVATKTVGNAHFPTFSVRGVLGQGNAAGTDRSLGIYLDGVPIAPGQGTSFDLPLIARMEIMRGPQGTLFGRNSTAGAINIVTPNPSGEFGFRQEVSIGNYDQFRTLTRIDTPTWGPFSALVAYTHDERRGDIRNTGAGVEWDRTAVGLGKAKSPATLGDKNAEAWFVAVNFAPSDGFNVTYKYDSVNSHFTPEGYGLVTFTSTDPTIRGYYDDAVAAGRLALAGPRRPKAVNNEFSTPGYIKSSGHSLTADIDVSESVTLKNIFGYRRTQNAGPVQLDGAGGLRTATGDPFLLLAGDSAYGKSSQWSNELQLNYESDFLTLTTGGIYVNSNVSAGPPLGLTGTLFGVSVPNFTFASRVQNNQLVTARTKSVAGYAQAEVHVTPEIDLIGGYRITNDKRDATAYFGVNTFNYTYNDWRSSYLAGINYRPNDNMMFYGKFSTGFLSGGAFGPIEFKPETVKAWEVGAKLDLLDRRVRFNLALFDAKYRNLQAQTQGFRIGPEFAAVSTVVASLGDLHVRGFESELTVAPSSNWIFSGSLGYTDLELSNINSAIFETGGTFYRMAFRANWTGNASAQYESEPLFGDARMVARIDGRWRSKIRQFTRFPYFAPAQEAGAFSPAGWVMNGRLALRDINIADHKVELALWGRNLFDNDRLVGATAVPNQVSTSYEPARTFGVELIFDF